MRQSTAEKREKILAMVAEGATNKQVADQMGIPLSTVGYHVVQAKREKREKRRRAQSPQYIDLPAITDQKMGGRCVMIIADVKIVRELVGGSW